MENQIVCPKCKRTISHNETVDAAAKSQGMATQHINCECGERITFWQITAQLRDQKTFGWKLKNWVRSLSGARAAK